MPTLLQRKNELLIAKLPVRFAPIDFLAANEILIRNLNADGSPFESPNKNVRRTAAVLLRTAQLQSVGNWFTAQSATRLEALEKELIVLLRMDDPTDDDEATLERLFSSAGARIKYAYADIAATTKAELDKLATILSGDTAPKTGAKASRKPLDASKVPVLGLTLAEHFKAQADGMALKFKAAVRAGLAAKDTLDGLIERVIGTDEAANVFCATGEGGGVDPTCGSSDGGGGSGARTGSKEFKAWFGDSKVTDESGKPMVVYHGSPDAKFSEFSPKEIGTSEDQGFLAEGFYFTNKPNVAEGYASRGGETGGVIPVHLAINKPFSFDVEDGQFSSDTEKKLAKLKIDFIKGDGETVARVSNPKSAAAILKRNGFDGVVLSADGGYKEFVAFKPEQIKSTLNKGTWSKTDKNISNEITDDHFINAAVLPSGLVVRVRLVNAAENSFAKMIQSAIQTVSNLVRQGAFADAEETDAEMGWEWNALHDGHVICPECEALDGSRWTQDFKPIGDAMEWPGFGQRHWGCLCSQIPVDLSEAAPASKTPLDDVFKGQSDNVLNTSFGKANIEAFKAGRMNGRQLLQQDSWSLSPDAMADLRGDADVRALLEATR